MADSPRFVADVMLGSLARWLRVLGVDVYYDSGIDDPELVDLAVAEGRTILTRDRRLVERRLARDHILIDSDEIEQQLLQVAREASLPVAGQELFGRCIDCNEPFEEIDAETARARVPSYVARTQDRFRYCRACDRVYWPATHVTRMQARLALLGLAKKGPPADPH